MIPGSEEGLEEYYQGISTGYEAPAMVTAWTQPPILGIQS